MPIFNGTSGNDTLTGGSGNDSLTGLAGDDVLDGGAGVDTMVGGIGDDIYYVDNANDVIVENSGEGNSDLVISLLPSTYLPGNVEDGVIAISTPATITGNFLDNTLYAGDGDNTFSGGDGRDEVSYYFSPIGVKVSLTATSSASINGNAAYLLLDIEDLSGSNFNDSLTGDSSDNNLYGGGGNDSLIGQAGSDYLNGGTDADFMAGGIGEDGYVVDNAGDVVAENPGEGEADFVYSSLVSYTLPDNVEAGVVIVSTPASLIGNSLNNLLYSGSGDNTLDGGAGTDFAGYAFAPAGVNVSLDIVGSQAINGSGSDTLLNIEGLSGSDFDDVLTGNSSDNSLYGGWGNDSLIGGAGHDYLSGGTGDDRLDGGADSDTASYTNANSAVRVDLSLESAQNTVGAGTDTLISIEKLVGSAFNDALSGDSGANIVSGQDGNDTVIGGLGNDTLSGGIGFDIFQFDTAPNSSTNLDIIIDFNTGIDKIALAHSVFTALPAPSIVSLQTGNFVSGAGVTSANDANDFIIYDSTTGALYYDADGSGGSAPIQVATLLGAPALIAADITFSDNASLVGDDGDNFLSGGAGNDTLDGGAGNDTLDGWVGNDSLVGGLGNDVASYSGAAGAVTVSLALQGSAQNTVNAGVDILFGMENLSGGSSNDSLTGDDGANILFGADGNDTLSGGGGNDTLEGGAGDNMFDGGDGRDAAVFWNSTISVNVDLSVTIPQYSSIGYNSFINIEDLQGSKFGDSLTGDARDNSIFGLAGNDYLTGKAGDDWLVGGLGDDAMDGGAGIDTASYDVDSTSGVTVTLVLTRLKTGGNLPDNRQNTGGAGVDNLFDIENLVGSSFSDKLTGNSGDNKLTGGQGNDTLEGGLGSDTAIFFGNSADFTISHIDSGFTVVDNNTADGNEGTDTIANMEFLQFRDKTIDVITLGAVLNGSSFNDTLIGGVGDDTLNGGIGNDFLDGVAGIDTATYFDPSTFLLHVEVSLTITDPQNTGDFGVDTLLNIENLIGSRGSDKLTGNDGPNRIEGKGGLDTIDGGLGNDTMIGGAHSDIFVVRDNGDVVVELWNNGQDRVDSYIANYTLPDNVEDGRILATGSANITGNEFVNSIDAGIGDNVIDGKGGAWDIVNYEFGVSGALGVTVSLAFTTPQVTGGSGTDTLLDIEWLYGSNNNDNITGNDANNVIKGNAGADMISGGVGIDELWGGAGNDTIFGGLDVDHLYGEEGNDEIHGDAGDDILVGGPGNDSLYGGAGDDSFDIDNGSNFIDGGDGLDFASTSAPIDRFTLFRDENGVITLTDTVSHNVDTLINVEELGFDGVFVPLVPGIVDNVYYGSIFDDTIVGSDGDDVLSAFEGNDNLQGGDGNDSIVGGAGNDLISGGNGIDTAIYAGEIGVTVSLLLQGAPQNTVGSGIDTLLSIENLRGSLFNDLLIGDASANRLTGFAGNDTLQGGDGDDTLNGGLSEIDSSGHLTGSDLLDGGDGNDWVDYDQISWGVTVSLSVQGVAQNTVGAGMHTLMNIENAAGSFYHDALTGNALSNMLVGAGGNDTLSGLAGDDKLTGGFGNDALDGGADIDTAVYADTAAGYRLSYNISSGDITVLDTNTGNGDEGQDVLTSIEVLHFGDKDLDLIQFSATVYLAKYDDLANVFGSDLAGATRHYVEWGFQEGRFTSTSSGNNETLTGTSGDDTLSGGAGNDTLNGDTGIDTAVYADTAAGYRLSYNISNGDITVLDTNTGNGDEGQDVLGSIEVLHFADKNLDLTQFNATAYLAKYDDLANVFGSDLAGATRHYVEWGFQEGRFISTSSGNNETLTGTSGDDTLTGGTGNDTLNGGTGIDTAVYADTAAGYRLGYNTSNGDITVLDTNTGNGDEGQDVLSNIEVLHFTDKNLDLTQFNAAAYLAKYDDLANVFGSDLAGATRHYVEWGFQEGRFISTSNGNNETLTGTSGDDTLAGGTGNDTLNGGTGIDTAVYADTAVGYRLGYNTSNGDITVLDTNTGNGDEGQDVLSNIEVLHFTDKNLDLTQFNVAAYLAKYDDLANVFGSDLAGATRHYVEWGFQEGRFTSTSSGNNETLTGTSGDETLSGGAGNDTLNGGTGIDTAVYADTAAGYRLSYNISNGDITVLDTNTGNGDEGQDVLSSIEVLHFADKNLDLTQFNATAYLAKYDDLANVFGSDLAGATRHYVEWGFQEGRFISTSSGNNETLTGTSGDDTLTGGAGNDSLNGGTGIDTAVYADTAAGYRLSYNTSNGDITVFDTNTGNGDEGQDVLSNIEVLHFTDKNLDLTQFNAAAYLAKYDDLANVFGSDLAGATRHYVEWGFQEGRTAGNGGNDVFNGTAGVDFLYGGTGNDTLDGLGGNDVLTGGIGIDRFVFSTALSSNNIDTVMDFVSGTDKIVLDNDIFIALTSAGALAAGILVAGPGATPVDGDDHLLYDSTTGLLYYDVDGIGGAAMQQILTLVGAPALTTADLIVS